MSNPSVQNDAPPSAALEPCSSFGQSSHKVRFYKDDAFLLDELSRFAGAALAAGDAVVVIATEAHRHGLTQSLQSRGFEAALAAEQGRYISLDAAETLQRFMLNGTPDAALFADVIGGVVERATEAAQGMNRCVSAFGEMVALLWEQGNAEGALKLERLWNQLEPECSLSLLCAYPMTGFSREDHRGLFANICSEHSHVIPTESYTDLTNQDQRLRDITYLQQRAQALESEIEQRKQVEDTLRRMQAELESLVEQRTAALRQLSLRLLNLQDAERRRIARELHDALGQSLVILKLNIDMLRQSPSREELWAESEELMQQCVSEVRTLSYLLHPPTMDAAGFTSAARWYVEGLRARSGLELTLDAPNDLGRLSDAIELALFRVLQEALTNVHLHSEASAATIVVRADAEKVVLEVKDNGCGIPKQLLSRFRATGAGMGVGLSGIGERVRELGGKFMLDSDGTGTLAHVTIPLSSMEVRP